LARYSSKPPDRDWVSGLPDKRKYRILRRWGYSVNDIVAMDSSQRDAEIQDAIRHGIYVGSLPSGPIEIQDPPIFLDEKSGQPIKISELIKRADGDRHCIMREPEPSPRPCSYKEALARFKKDETLDSADRKHLNRLAADTRMIKHWEFIQRCRPLITWAASPGWLVWHVLVARRAAEFFGDYPQKQRYAENTENLARYLRLKGETDESTCQLLEDLALQLRQPEALEPFKAMPVPVSRKGRNTIRGRETSNTRELKAFMNLMANHFKATYGQPLYDVVATLTDSAFPGRETTVDHVRNAVKPTRTKDRSGKR
jgi:hypothetical protein